MGKEVERKFRVVNDGWRDAVETKSVLRQGYLSIDKGRTVRVRVADVEATLTIKGITVGATRPEYEYEIPEREADEILRNLCLQPIVEKTRYRVPFGGRTWEIDEFTGANEGLVIAEVELDSEDDAVDRPDWVGKEVTGDPRFFNANLVARPYREW